MTAARLVLIADDDPDIRTLVRLHLELAGFEVMAAPNGTRALELARDRRPAIAVLDVKMPGLDGVELTRELVGDSVPVLLLSASATEADVDAGLAAGAVAYVTKPFRGSDLVDRVRALAT